MKEQRGLSSLRIVIADDEKTTRQGLQFLIRQSYPTIEISEARNGSECWEVLSSTETLIQLAFIDIRMPGMDGIQVSEKVHAEGLPTKMVIISGFRDFDYARQALRCGITDYLLKPVNPSDVLHHVHTLVTHSANLLPPVPLPDTLNEKQERLVIELIRKWIHDHLHTELTLQDLSEKFHYSPSYLSTLFKKETGKGFSEYLTDCRMQRAKHLLLDPSLRISDIASQVSYTNSRAFSIAFRKIYTITPTRYREKRGIDSLQD